MINKRMKLSPFNCSHLFSRKIIQSVVLSSLIAFNASAGMHTTETQKYLVIATGDGSSEFFSFKMSNVEIGADQEVISSGTITAPQRTGKYFDEAGEQFDNTGSGEGYGGGLSHRSEFVAKQGDTPKQLASKDGNRWDDRNAIAGDVDRLPDARPLYQGVDYSGNVALTGTKARFQSSNDDVNADIGIVCNRNGGCADASNSVFFANDGNANPFDDDVVELKQNQGVSKLVNTTDLLTELEQQRDWIVGLELDHTLTHGYNNRNIKADGLASTIIETQADLDAGGTGRVIYDLDALDKNDDGYAVINIDVGSDQAFSLINTDWILQSTEGTIAIFRMANGTQFDFSKSSIMLGDGNVNSNDIIDELGAIFFQDALKGTNEVFNLNNVILGGIGLWDFTDFNPDRGTLLNPETSAYKRFNGDATLIKMNDAQGCAQFISHAVNMQDNRWNRCSLAEKTEVPEPPMLALFTLALLGLVRQRAISK